MAKRTRRKKPRQEVVEAIDPQTLARVVNKEFGEGTMRFANDPSFKITRIPTGVLSLDVALGGGFPRGRHAEIYGGYAVGKTTVVYRTIAAAQRMKLKCAFVDVEQTFDPAFAASAGVKLDELIIHRQEHGEKAFDCIETMLRAGDFGVIGLDSIAALLPKTELEDKLEGGGYNMHQAKLMSKALRKLTPAIGQTVLLYINQLRDSIGGFTFGKRSTTTGGRAMAFYASVRLDLSRVETLKKKKLVIEPKTGDEVKKELVYGHRVLVKIDKEKAGGAHTGDTTSFVFDYELGGIDLVEDLIYLGRQTSLVHKRGDSWWVDGYDDEAQKGRKKFHAWLRKNVAVAEELEGRIMEEVRS